MLIRDFIIATVYLKAHGHVKEDMPFPLLANRKTLLCDLKH